LVDDDDLLASPGGGPLDTLLDLLPQAADIGLHVVLTRNAAGSARLSVDPVVRRLQETNTPDLALSCPPNELPLLNGMRPPPLPPRPALLGTPRTATMLHGRPPRPPPPHPHPPAGSAPRRTPGPPRAGPPSRGQPDEHREPPANEPRRPARQRMASRHPEERSEHGGEPMSGCWSRLRAM